MSPFEIPKEWGKDSSKRAHSERIEVEIMTKIVPQIEVVAVQNGLSDAAIRLLEVITRPECRTMTITKICEIADISRTTYYSLFKDDSFKAAYTQLCQVMLLSGAASSSQALIAQAAMGDTTAIKMILELAGIYQPSTTVNHTHTIEAGPSLKELYDSRRLGD